MARLPPAASSRQVFDSRHFGLAGIVMLGRYRHASSQVGLKPHAHGNAIEICFLERGEQTYRVKSRVHRLHGAEQFFTLPGEVHDTGNLPQERGILYWLILSLEPSKELLGLSASMGRRLRQELRRMPVRHFKADADCGRLLREIFDVLMEKGRAGALRPIRLQALVLHYLTLTIQASHRDVHQRVTPVIERVLAHIEAHLGDPVHVPELARIAHLSESRFKIRFKQETGVPPAEFWLRKKIERAEERLKSRPVIEVAYELGFSSSQYFATAFKRYMLVAPSRFRSG